jgi:hypothetical protein
MQVQPPPFQVLSDRFGLNWSGLRALPPVRTGATHPRDLQMAKGQRMARRAFSSTTTKVDYIMTTMSGWKSWRRMRPRRSTNTIAPAKITPMRI